MLWRCSLSLLAVPAYAAMSWSRLTEPWPEDRALGNIAGHCGELAEQQPVHARADRRRPGGQSADSRRWAVFIMPPGNHAPRSVPAVVLLHGSGGVLPMRELTYAAQLAAMGVAALVVDSFAARRDRGTEFLERVLNITETMMLADAYSGLAFLASRPEIDPEAGRADRVFLRRHGDDLRALSHRSPIASRRAGRASPAMSRFTDPALRAFADSRTTGAPLLMLLGGEDEITDRAPLRRDRR